MFKTCYSKKIKKKCRFCFLFHSQGIELHPNATAGILLTDHSLVLQSISKTSSGDYTCLAANTEGKGNSNSVSLRVRCEFKLISNLCIPIYV